MKICFIMPSMINMPSGGFQIVYEYANRLSNLGHEINIYYPVIDEMFTKVDPDTCIENLFFCIRNKFPIYDIRPDWFDFTSPVKHILIPEISDMYLEKHDAIIATAWSTAHMINRLNNKGKKLYLIQGYEAILTDKFPENYIIETYSLGYKNIVISKWLKTLLEELNAPVAAYIPNGISLEKFYIKNAIETRNPLSVAMLWHSSIWKGTNDGIQALNMVKEIYPNLSVTLFGVHPRQSSVPNWMHYKQSPSRSELCDIYNHHAIFANSSVLEGFGLTGAEAMACGCALAATDSKGVLDYATHNQTALISEPKEPTKLAQNIIYLIENNRLRNALAKAGNENIQSFSWQTAITRFENLLHNI